MTGGVEKIITRPIVFSKLKRTKLDQAQRGINDKIHNDEKDYGEIEKETREVEKIITRPIVFTKSKGTKLDQDQSSINEKIHNDEKDYDEIELSTSETVQNDTNDEIHDHEIDLDEVELSTSEQWERVNDLLLLITTILIFNATSLIIAFFQITWKAEGTVFNKALVLQSHKTIGMLIL